MGTAAVDVIVGPAISTGSTALRTQVLSSSLWQMPPEFAFSRSILVGNPLEAGAAVYRWCTDEVEPHDRFDYWREVRAKGLFGVTVELERERRADFFGEFSLHQLGGAGLVELKASHYTVERSSDRHR